MAFQFGFVSCSVEYMNENTICKTCSQPLKIKLPAYAPDEKLAFVERVCGLLIESRYGPYRPYQLLAQISDEPEREDCTFYDLTGEGPVPSYVIEFINDVFVEKLSRDLYSRRVGVFALIPPRFSPQVSPRGSPAPLLSVPFRG